MIWTMKPTAKKLEDVETKIGNVGNTDLQSQVTTLTNKVGNVGSTDLQSQVTTLNSNMSNIEEFYGTDLHPSINSIYAKKSVRTVTLTIVSKETSEGVDIKAGNTLGKIDKSCVSGRSTLIPVYLYVNGKMINGTVWANSSGSLAYYGEDITQKMIAFGTYVN